MNQIRVQANLKGAHIETLDGKNVADIEPEYCLVELKGYSFPIKITPENYGFLKNTLELFGGISGIEE